METNKEESILHEPLIPRREASCSRREPPLRSAAAGRGMVRRKVGKLLFPVLTAMFVPGAAALGELRRGLMLPVSYLTLGLKIKKVVKDLKVWMKTGFKNSLLHRLSRPELVR